MLYFLGVVAERKLSRPLPATPPLKQKSNDLSKYPWFSDSSRKEAEVALASGKFLKETRLKMFIQSWIFLGEKFDGRFLVRKSEHGGSESPFSLTVLKQGTVFHLNIRILPDGNCVLGKKKSNEKVNFKKW